jgi:D-tyrosyl-tRNA(Tyr) deacylase
MRAVLQRVSRAEVEVDGNIVGQIGRGWLVLLGVERGDTPAESDWLAEKTAGLRAFADADGKMNLDVTQANGAVLVVSQFTLLGDCRKGRRPGFDAAAEPGLAEPLYRHYCELLARAGLTVATGVFRAHMNVSLTNDGPVTFLLERRPKNEVAAPNE